MSDYDSDYSRISSRGRKRKQNRLLNLLIVIVLLLVVIVGYSIFFTGGGSRQASGSKAQHSNNDPNNNGNKGTNGGASHKNKKKSDVSNKENKTSNNKASNNTTNGTKSNDSKQKTDKQKKKVETTGPHNLAIPQGPWNPVGTQQQSPHHTSYSSSSQDWNEQLQALYEATGLSADNSTLWWMERDGGDGKSVGYISPKSNESAFYIVHIKWVDQKGWQPVKVERKYIKDPHVWYEQKKSQ